MKLKIKYKNNFPGSPNPGEILEKIDEVVDGMTPQEYMKLHSHIVSAVEVKEVEEVKKGKKKPKK